MNAGRDPKIVSTGDMVRYTIIPSASWKGESGDTLHVYSALASCGYGFVVGEEYLVFGRIARQEFFRGTVYAGGATFPLNTVGLCSRTAPSRHIPDVFAILGIPNWERNAQ